SLAEVVDGVVQFGPEALRFEGADEPFGAAVGFWLTNEGGVVSDTEPGDRPQEVLRAVLRAPVMAEAYASSHVGSEPAEAVDDGVVTGCNAAIRSPVLATWVHASADQWSTLANTHTHPS